MDRGIWQAAVHMVAQSRTRLNRLRTHAHLFILLFTSFIFGHARSLLLRGFSLVAASRSYPRVVVCGLLIAVLSPMAEHGLQGMQASAVVAHGLNNCGSWPPEHRLKIVARELSHGMCVGSSQSRNQTHVSCSDRQILYH